MYGYIKPHTPELKVREQEYYRAVYCGLCRALGKCTGQCSRLTLSYDFTFLALVRLALEDKTVTVAPRRCVIHPLKKKPMAEPDATLAFCAYASAILAYHKLQDDRRDERGRRKCKAVIASPYVRGLRRKALKKGYRDLDDLVGAAMDELSSLEASGLPTVDRPADLFGRVMADLSAYGLSDGKARLARSLGHHLGRWIYLIDAIDDLEEDKARKRYNPFDRLWQGGDMTDTRREDLSRALMSELVAVEGVLDLADPVSSENNDLWGVLRNILYMGMPATAHRVLYPPCDTHAKKA